MCVHMLLYLHIEKVVTKSELLHPFIISLPSSSDSEAGGFSSCYVPS